MSHILHECCGPTADIQFRVRPFELVPFDDMKLKKITP
jgi:hypothetical protein